MCDEGTEIIKTWACSWGAQIRKKLMWQIKDANWIMPLSDSHTVMLPHFSQNKVHHLFISHRTLQDDVSIYIFNVIFHPTPPSHQELWRIAAINLNNHIPCFYHADLQQTPKMTFPNSTLACPTNAYLTKEFFHETFLTYPNFLGKTDHDFVFSLFCKIFNVNTAILCTCIRCIFAFLCSTQIFMREKSKLSLFLYPRNLVLRMNGRMS